MLLETHLPQVVANVWNGSGLFPTANEQVAKGEEEHGKSMDEEVERQSGRQSEPMEVDVTVAKPITVGLPRRLSIPSGIVTDVPMGTDRAQGLRAESPVPVSSGSE